MAFIIAVVVISVGVSTWLHEASADNGGFTWLTPASFDHLNRPSALVRFKYALLRWMGPITRHIRSHRPVITMETKVLALSGGVTNRPPSGELLATNEDGTCAWALSADELATLHRLLKDNRATSVSGAGTITTADGSAASMSMGRFNLSVAAHVEPRIVRVRVSSVTTGVRVGAAPLYPIDLRTNLSVALQAAVPNRGALLVTSGTPVDGSNYWLLVCPSAVDYLGRPLP